jgi:hypothetical protein
VVAATAVGITLLVDGTPREVLRSQLDPSQWAHHADILREADALRG